MRLKPLDPVAYTAEQLLTGELDGSFGDGTAALQDRIVIDRVLGKSWYDLVSQISSGSLNENPFTALGEPRPSDVVPQYSFQDVCEGILLLVPDGSYGGGLLSVDAVIKYEHRGQHLGAELMLEALVMNGNLPTWNLDQAGYTPAGAAAVESAVDLARDRKLFHRKAARSVARAFAAWPAQYSDVAQPSLATLADRLGIDRSVSTMEGLTHACIDKHGFDAGMDALEEACQAYVDEVRALSRPSP